MRKIVPILISFFLTSCSKSDCDCGIVEGAKTEYDGISSLYYLDVRLGCTGAILTDIDVTESIYNEYGKVGYRICDIN